MSGSKHGRQRISRQQQLRAAAEAKRRQARRRSALLGGLAVLLVAVIVVVVLIRGGGKKTPVAVNGTSTTAAGSTATTAAGSTATTAVAAGSAAGKPCLAVTDALPAGAPAVPVTVGAPPTQLVSRDLKVGSGAVVTANETLTVNYIGVACSTGKIFDSSYSRGQPASFALTGVIKGWQDGIPGMRVGGQRLLGIPPALAYGVQGYPPTIAPNETLWFVVDVVDAKAS